MAQYKREELQSSSKKELIDIVLEQGEQLKHLKFDAATQLYLTINDKLLDFTEKLSESVISIDDNKFDKVLVLAEKIGKIAENMDKLAARANKDILKKRMTEEVQDPNSVEAFVFGDNE